MKDFFEIEIDNGVLAVIDSIDHDLIVGRGEWKPLHSNNTTYAVCWHGEKFLYMHRVIMDVKKSSIFVDHRDGDGLNNRRGNLRLATSGQNEAASRRKRPARTSNHQSTYKGVHWDPARNRWRAMTTVMGQSRFIGRFHTEIEAAQAYDQFAFEQWGEFAGLNFPEAVK